MREYSELEKIRLAKLERLRVAGMEPYPTHAERTHLLAEALADYEKQPAAGWAAKATLCHFGFRTLQAT